jgi:uncharacterized protein with beta-barrel porin domain
MKRIVFILFLVVAIAAWCSTPAFAVAENVGPGGSPYDTEATGNAAGYFILNGGVAWTLRVIAGDNIFTNNIAGPYTTSAIDTNNASLSSINFLGSSNVYGTIGATAKFLNITAGTGASSTVDFRGTVNGTTLNVGAGTVSFNSHTLTNVLTDTNFTGDGTINVARDTAVASTLSMNGGAAQEGTLNLGGAAAGQDQWTGSIGTAFALRSIEVDNGSTAGVTSQITGAVHTYAFDLGTNTLNLRGGAFANELIAGPAGAIYTTLANATVYGKIDAVGAFTYTGGATVNVTVPTGAYIPVGTIFTIVDNNGAGTTGTPVTVTTVGGTNPLYTFTANPTNVGNILITLTGSPITAAEGSSNPAAAAVGDVLLTLPVTSDIVLAINALTDAAAVVNAEAQLVPSTPSLAAPLVTFQGAREFQNLWLSRLDACREVSWPSKENSNCKGEDSRNGWWLKGFGYFGNQEARGALTEYDSRIVGTMLAYDVPLGLNTRAGLGFGYAQSTIDGKTYDAETDFDTYQATAYIGHERGPWFVHGSASFGWNEYSDMRHIEFPGIDRIASADYNGQDYTAFARTGYHFPVQKFTITPLASLQYSRVNIEGYTETGAGDANLVVESQHYDFLESGLGAKVERDFSFRNWAFVPEVRFEWLHELSNPKLQQTAEFNVGSPSFTTDGLKTVADTYHAGTGLTLLSCACSATRWSLEGGYDYYWRVDGYAANQVTMRVTARF